MAAETPVQKDRVVSAFSEWSDKLRWDALTEKTRKAVQLRPLLPQYVALVRK